MATGDSRRGRRDNGFIAAEYAAAGDVDPRVGEHLLDVLALQGIAAYLHPSADQHPITRSSTLPARPVDRLFVDRAHLQTAQGYLASLAEDEPGQNTNRAEPAVADPTSIDPTSIDQPAVVAGAPRATDSESASHAPTKPAPPERPEDYDTTDLEDAWSKIVAGYDDEVEPPQRSWPASEDVSATEERPERRWRAEPGPTIARRGSATDAAAADEPSLLDGLDTFGAHLPDPEEEGYTPPSPPPVPRPSLPTAMGIIGIIGGLVVFLRSDLLPFGPSASMLIGVTAMVGGFAALVWRLRPDDDDIDPDDGARV